MDALNVDAWREIFSYLPITALGRFSTASKQLSGTVWNTYIVSLDAMLLRRQINYIPPFPAILASPARVQYCYLSRDNIGSLPEEILQRMVTLRNLKHLGLEGCARITQPGWRSLHSLKNLTSLNLNWCFMLQDADLRELCAALRKLKRLHLSACSALSDDGFRALWFLHDLQELDASRSLLSDDTIRVISTKLTSLNVARVPAITRNGYKQISERLVNLEYLDISGCSEFEESFVLLSSLTKLKSLSLNGASNITNEATLRLCAALTHLTYLSMRYCLNLTDQATANFSNLTSLVWLSISGNKLSDVMLDNLAWATNLSVLDIPKSDVTDVGVARFASMYRYITHINLEKSQISDDALKSLITFQQSLVSLTISDCSFSDDGMKLLENFTFLHYLNISSCDTSDSGLRAITNLRFLEKLDLNNCSNISDEGVLQLTRLTRLKHVDLTWCNITPEAIDAMATKIERIDRPWEMME